MRVLLSILLSLSCMGPPDNRPLKWLKERKGFSLAASSSGLNASIVGDGLIRHTIDSSSEGRPFLKVVDLSSGCTRDFDVRKDREEHFAVVDIHLKVTPDSLKSFGPLSEEDFIIIGKDNPEMNVLIAKELGRNRDPSYRRQWCQSYPEDKEERIGEVCSRWCTKKVIGNPKSSITFMLYCSEKGKKKLHTALIEESKRRDSRPLSPGEAAYISGKMLEWSASMGDDVSYPVATWRAEFSHLL